MDRLEYNRLVLEGMNQSFEEIPTSEQNLSFHTLEKEMIHAMHIATVNQDILKTLELYSDKNGYNNAGALLADQNKFPEKTFREAIANALVYRAWDVNASIKVSMYEDRIEISSPGGLPSGMSEQEF